MAGPRDLSALSIEELQQEYVRYVRLLEDREHVGRQNRLGRGQLRVLDELKSRADGTLRLLLPMRAHADPVVQLSASSLCKSLDPDGYRKKMEALVTFGGVIAKRAQESLKWDEWVKAHPSSPQPVSSPSDFDGLSASTEPAGLSHAELEDRVRSAFPLDLAEPIISLARPTIGIWPQPFDADADPGASRFGGMPVVPRVWNWPTRDDEPMLFVGQINCAELAGLSSTGPLPRSGLISFFGDFDFLNGCTGGAEEDGGAVFYWAETESLLPSSEPIDDFQRLRSCALAFYETYSLPDPRSQEIEQLPLDLDQRKRYRELHDVVRRHGVSSDRFRDFCTSKLLGWPDLIQNDFLPGPGGEHRERLLLQVGSYDDGTDFQDWGSGGLVYFAISERNLRERRFDQVLFEMQCT
ncbi:MAG TPA: DUF1963 domain-containing protein [Stellaceae bacterium]|nr:DUF1963 domain-containing protein [Stellaceae bacterium]